MPVDPQCLLLLEQMKAFPSVQEIGLHEARQAVRGLGGLMGAPEAVAEVRDELLPGPSGEIPVRFYGPGVENAPVLLYFHGGGWVLGDLELADPVCRALANRAGATVISVDYRLAPEHRYPAALDDSYAVASWVAEHAAELGLDSSRIAVGGDSAGGNLAAAVSLMARDRGAPSICFQMLVYPIVDHALDTPSHKEFGGEGLLTTAAMEWFWAQYVPDVAERESAYVSPLRALDLAGLPPTFLATAEFDPLRDEGEAYAQRLRAAGVLVGGRQYQGMIHGFMGMLGVIDRGWDLVDDAAIALGAAFRLG